MTAQILDGKATAAAIKSELTARVAALKERGVTPGLGTVLVGDDPGSQKYVAGKHRDCAQVGIASIQRELPATATQEEIEAVVRELNEDPACTGYIVQLPLPRGIDENRILELMDPDKDADGLHPMNLGRLVLNEPAPLPCTPNGILTLLRRYGVEIKGAEVVVVGRGVTIGRPMPLLLTRRSENATVTQCHTGTRDLAAHLKRADIVIAAAGSPHLVRPEDVKPGARPAVAGAHRDTAGRRGPAADRAGRVPLGAGPGRRRVAAGRRAPLDDAPRRHARRALALHGHRDLRRPRPLHRPAGADGPAEPGAGDPVPQGHPALHGQLTATRGGGPSSPP